MADVAVAGAEQISDIVNQMKTLAKQASDGGISDESRDAYNKDFTALRDQLGGEGAASIQWVDLPKLAPHTRASPGEVL